MNKLKRTMSNAWNFIRHHKLHLTGLLVLSVVFIFVLIAFLSNKQITITKETLEQYVSSKPKSIDDLTENEKEILGTINKEEDLKKEAAEKTYSKEYLEYEKLSDEEKEKIEAIPRKEEIPFSELEEIKEEQEETEEIVIPESYNLKDHINIKVENQYGYGLCWDFASMKSLETNVLLHEGRDLDLSELHLDYYQSNLMYGDREAHDGGSFSIFKDYSLLTGAVSEEDVPYGSTFTNIVDGKEYHYFNPKKYNETEYSNFTNLNNLAQATEVVDFPSIRKTNGKLDNKTEEELSKFRKLVKTHIMNNGSLYASIKSTTDYNSYCADQCWGDHAVSIVGWDDNYSKDNFEKEDGSKPIHDGAYIALNSWGEYGKGKGYYYISYDDQLIENQLSGVVSTSMDKAIKISSIENPIVKEIIYNQLKYYIMNYNNEEYITKIALEKISNLELQNKNLTSDNLNGIELFKNVTNINLQDNNITDISILANLKRLSIINLSNNNIMDVSALKDIENIYILNLSGNKNVTGYESLSNVINLCLSNTNLITLNDMSSTERLNQLDLSNNLQLDYDNLKLPTKIWSVILDNTNFSNYDFSSMEHLYHISLKNNHLKDLKGIKGTKRLNELDVSDNEITDFSTLETLFEKVPENDQPGYYSAKTLIAKSNNITDLSTMNNINIDCIDLSNNKITKGLAQLKNIRDITLNNCDLTNLEELSKLEKVNNLVLDNNKIENLKGLQELKQLLALSLNNNKLTDISDIAELSNLYNLNIDNNSKIDVSPLKDMKKLSTLSLAGNKNLKGELPDSIYRLNLKDCNIDDSLRIKEILQISYVNLSNTNVSCNDVKSIIANTESSWIQIEDEGLNLTEEEFLSMDEQIQENKSKQNKKYIYLKGMNVNIPMSLDENNNINLNDKYYIRKKIMNSLSKNVWINNGNIDNKVNFIHIVDDSKKQASFKTDETSNPYQSTTINLTY